jgi:hypothetical protein
MLVSGLLLPNQSFAMLKLKISMTHKLGIDKNLVLKSELHSVEEFLGEEEVIVVMRNGFKLKIYAGYLSEQIGIGPTDIIQIKAFLYNPSGELIRKFLGEEARVSLWTSQSFIFNGSVGQQFEITVVPIPN